MARPLRQDEVADLARVAGLDWRQSTVAAIETGRREVSLGEALILLGILRVPLAKLLATEDAVVDVDGALIDKADWRRMSQGQPVRIEKSKEKLERFYKKRHEDVALARSYGLPAADIWKAVDVMLNEAERKAAASLSLDAFELSLLALSLWGRGLTDERDRRLVAAEGGGDPHVRRGHVTRQLLDELRVGVKARRGAGHKKGRIQ